MLSGTNCMHNNMRNIIMSTSMDVVVYMTYIIAPTSREANPKTAMHHQEPR